MYDKLEFFQSITIQSTCDKGATFQSAARSADTYSRGASTAHPQLHHGRLSLQTRRHFMNRTTSAYRTPEEPTPLALII